MTDKKRFLAFKPDRYNTSVGVSEEQIEAMAKNGNDLKMLLILPYLRDRLETHGSVRFTLNEITKGCGYPIKSNTNSNQTNFAQAINKCVVKAGYATCDYDLDKPLSPMKQIQLQMSTSNNIFYYGDNFISLSMKEYDLLTKQETKSNKATLLGVYLLLKKNMYLPYGQEPSVMASRRPFSFPSKKYLKNTLWFKTDAPIEKAIADLINIKMIFPLESLYIKIKEKKYTYFRNVYSIDSDFWSKQENIDVALAEIKDKTHGRHRTVCQYKDLPIGSEIVSHNGRHIKFKERED